MRTLSQPRLRGAAPETNADDAGGRYARRNASQTLQRHALHTLVRTLHLAVPRVALSRTAFPHCAALAKVPPFECESTRVTTGSFRILARAHIAFQGTEMITGTVPKYTCHFPLPGSPLSSVPASNVCLHTRRASGCVLEHSINICDFHWPPGGLFDPR